MYAWLRLDILHSEWRNAEIGDTQTVDPTDAELAVDTRCRVVCLAHLHRPVRVPHRHRGLIDKFLPNAISTHDGYGPLDRGEGSYEAVKVRTYQDVLVRNTLRAQDVSPKVLANRGLLLELHRRADQVDHDFPVERMVEQLQIYQRGVIGIGGLQGDGSSRLRVHEDSKRCHIAAGLGHHVVGRDEHGAVSDLIVGHAWLGEVGLCVDVQSQVFWGLVQMWEFEKSAEDGAVVVG